MRGSVSSQLQLLVPSTCSSYLRVDIISPDMRCFYWIPMKLQNSWQPPQGTFVPNDCQSGEFPSRKSRGIVYLPCRSDHSIVVPYQVSNCRCIKGIRLRETSYTRPPLPHATHAHMINMRGNRSSDVSDAR